MASSSLAGPDIEVLSLLDGSTPPSMAEDVRAGLSSEPKELHPKYFYDDRGSELFDLITTQPEYYPTRCERAILNRCSPEIIAVTGAQELVELGSGTASKTRALLYAMAGAGVLQRYVPVDISPAVVRESAGELAEQYPGLSVRGVVGDFERDLERLPGGDRRLFAFLGGTIGNLYPDRRARFLSGLADLMGDDDHLLLGTGLVGDVEAIEAAYNDAAGVTAEFNRNVLHAINRELGGDFDVERFEHVAFFNRESSWIEMRLRAVGEHRVRVAEAGLEVVFDDGEEMRTEISTKFTPQALTEELEAAGLALDGFFLDPTGLFSLTLASPR